MSKRELVCVLIAVTSGFASCNKEELFQQDLGQDMEIGISETGYKSLRLKCGSNSMYISLETEDDFYGVIYTRGSFHAKQAPCFYDPRNARGQRSFSIKFPLDKCKTFHDGDVYSNVLVVQNDKDLILPGDAAFNLECDFRKSHNFTVTTDYKNKKEAGYSRITLTNPDMSTNPIKREKRWTVVNNSHTVEYIPERRRIL